MTSPTRLHHFVSTFLILSLILASTACSSEENYTDPASNIDAQTTPIGNSDSSAIITGVDSGSVTEDVDPNTDGNLTVSGKLNIVDSDANEAMFISILTNLNYGRFAFTTNGNWHYFTNNFQSAIQNLSAGQFLTDTLTVSSIDGTKHNIIITINGADEANQPAKITGIDRGSVTEDVSLNNSNQLTANGKLNIVDNDEGEAAFISTVKTSNYGRYAFTNDGIWFYLADNSQNVIQNLSAGQFLSDTLTISSIDGTKHNIVITINGADEANQPAKITGIDRGSVTEDVNLNSSNQLTANGKLNIIDNDEGEAAFISAIKTSNYGRYAFTNDGIWFYIADNTQNVIQNLATGQSLTDTLTISSIDGTKHNIIITINGADETSTFADITVSWTAPSQREDDTSISLSEIAGYKVYYGLTKGQYNNSININDGTATGHTIKALPTDTYYIVVTTIDTDDRESQYSLEKTVSN